MKNRDGDFVLIFQPSDFDRHFVSADTLHSVSRNILRVIEAGQRASGGARGQISLVHTASPEFGSIRFNMLAITSGLAVAASASQVTGVDVADIVRAMQMVIAPTATAADATPSPSRLAADTAFRSTVQKLVQEAAAGGFDSVRIEVPGEVTVELSRSVESATAAEDDLRDQVAELREAVRRQRQRAVALEREIKHITAFADRQKSDQGHEIDSINIGMRRKELSLVEAQLAESLDMLARLERLSKRN